MSTSGSEKRARKYTVSTRATEDEKNAIRARANAYGLSLGAFIREIALDKPLPKANRFTKEQGQFVAAVLSSLSTMMDHVRKLDQQQSTSPYASHIAHLKSELLFLRDRCFEVLGRKS